MRKAAPRRSEQAPQLLQRPRYYILVMIGNDGFGDASNDDSNDM